MCYATVVQFAIRLLRQTFESVVRKGEVPPLPVMVPEELAKPEGGVYVAAYENPGRLPRGRVGSYLPTKASLAEEIQAQAVNLAHTYPFRKEDLAYLTYELLLTRTPFLLANITDLEPHVGLLVRLGHGRSAISLPGAQTRSPEERLREACRQGGIDPAVSDIRMYKFAIDVVSEEKRVTRDAPPPELR